MGVSRASKLRLICGLASLCQCTYSSIDLMLLLFVDGVEAFQFAVCLWMVDAA